MNEERKVLISFKISTLLIVLLAITVLIVLTVVIAKNLAINKKVVAMENIEQIQEVEEKIENNILEENEENTERLIKATITSRSAISRVDEHIEQEEEVELIVEEPQTTPIEEVKISKDMDLTVRTGLSKEDFILLISNVEQDTSNFFEENAGLIYDLCEKYQINEIFFCGLISAESGWNIAGNHRRTHNYISLMTSNGLIKFASVEEGLEKAAKTLHDNYLTEGGRFYYGPTLSGVKTKFCPASSTWVNLVYQRMAQVLN